MIAQVENETLEPQYCDASSLQAYMAPNFGERGEIVFILATTAVFSFILMISLWLNV